MASKNLKEGATNCDGDVIRMTTILGKVEEFDKKREKSGCRAIGPFFPSQRYC